MGISHPVKWKISAENTLRIGIVLTGNWQPIPAKEARMIASGSVF